MTVDEVAEHLRLSRSKVYEMAQNGEIPCSKVASRWRFLRSEIDSWMLRKREPPLYRGATDMNCDLTQEESLLLRIISHAGTFESRLVERSDGDHEFLQNGAPAELKLSEGAVLRTLRRLERRELVTHWSTVHPDDSSEYIITWRLTTKGAAADRSPSAAAEE